MTVNNDNDWIDNEVLDDYKAGRYIFAVPPPVQTEGWDTLAWINNIGKKGFYMLFDKHGERHIDS